MKIRKGFVSNSSTTSFLLAIPNSLEECSHCGLGQKLFFDILIETLNTYTDGNKRKFSKKQTLEEYIEGIENDLRSAKENLECGQKEYDIIKTLIKDFKSSLDNVSEVYEKIQRIKEHGLNYLKEMLECSCGWDINQELEILEQAIKYKAEEVIKLEKDLAFAKSLTNVKELIEIEMDHGWKSDIEKRIEILAERGVVTVLKHETT